MENVSLINQMLIDKLGPLGPLYAVGILGVFLILLTLPTVLRRRADPLDRLKSGRGSSRKGGDTPQSLRQGRGNEKLDRYAEFLEPQSEEEFSAIRLKLLQAGYRQRAAVRTFHFMQFVLGIGFLCLGVIYVLFSAYAGQELSVKLLAVSVALPGFVGYYLPKYWVERRRQTRKEEITNGFPDSLDLMLVCVEAGQSLDQSIVRVSSEIRAGYPALADEFEMVAQEIKAGKERVQVLKDMSVRVGVTDISSFVTVLVQSATFGTSIADALRVYADEMRDKRVMRAEEKANVLPTKLTLGTMMFTVPPLLLIMIGPAIHAIFSNLSGN